MNGEVMTDTVFYKVHRSFRFILLYFGENSENKIGTLWARDESAHLDM